MKGDVEWLLQHGWGFDAGCWEPWIKLIPANHLLHSGERGYFGARESFPSFRRKRSFKIIAAHSMGWLFLSPELFRQADRIVLISSFSSFHPAEKEAAKHSRNKIDRMLEKMEESSIQVLNDFYERCGYSGSLLQCQIDKEKLMGDLEKLNEDGMLSEFISGQPVKRSGYNLSAKILLLHGGKDLVVPVERALLLQKKINSCPLKIIEGAGHALPFTHAQECLKIVRIRVLSKQVGTRSNGQYSKIWPI